MKDQLRTKFALALAALGFTLVSIHHVIVPIIMARADNSSSKDSMDSTKEGLYLRSSSSYSSSSSSSSTDPEDDYLYQKVPQRYPPQSFTLPPDHWKDPSRWDGDESVDWDAYWEEKLSRGALQYFRDAKQPIVPALPGQLSCLDPLGPPPVIIMGMGHTESMATFEILTKFMAHASISFQKQSNRRKNMKPAPFMELTGPSVPRSINFFQFLEQQTEKLELESEATLSTAWMESFLCYQQTENSKSALVGFQWKPYHETMDMAASRDALERVVALHKEKATPITVIRLKSNLLDSYTAHKNTLSEGSEGSKASKISLDISGEGELYKSLKNWQLDETFVDDWLITHQVPVVTVDVDDLFYSQSSRDATKAWKSLWKALGRSSSELPEDLPQFLDENFPKILPRSIPSQRHSLENYSSVAKELKNTDLEYLLRNN